MGLCVSVSPRKLFIQSAGDFFFLVLYRSISLQYSFHSYCINKHHIKLQFLTDMNRDYMFRLKLAVMSIPGTLPVPNTMKYNAFQVFTFASQPLIEI